MFNEIFDENILVILYKSRRSKRLATSSPIDAR
jgi:hypothetical protein